MKRRFHVLHGEIRLSPEKASRIITACAILHNVCKQRNIPQPEENEDDENENDDYEDDDDDADDDGVAVHIIQSGLAYRDHFANMHFG